MSAAELAPNPFAQDVPQHLPEPSTLVMFGATGDLASRKLLPAVYNLALGGQLPERFRLLGVALDGDVDAFRAHAEAALREFSRSGLDAQAWTALRDSLDYLAGDFGDERLYAELAKRLDALDRAGGGPTRRLFYLATAPPFFGRIAKGLHAAGLGRRADPPTRLITEKPFGHDLASAIGLNRSLQSAFGEQQIFRIDHYLGKETVQNLLVLRFANGIFEPLWNRRYIDHVQITVAEELGIGHRAGYYDHAGALRDIVQNHMLQVLALVAMEPPVSFTADLIRDEKVKALRAVKPLGAEAIASSVVRGQYGAGWVDGKRVPGYRDEDGVAADSRTETFVALRLEVDNWRWAGTPFYLRTGKRLRAQEAEIALRFRPVPHLPFAGAEAGDVTPNELIVSIQPNEGATLKIVAKLPGPTLSVRPVEMEFQYGTAFLRESPEAYERLLHDALLGNATLFTRADEVESAWRIADPVLAAWATSDAEPETYPAGSDGPPTAAALLAREGRAWRPL